jgi:hypothetical protein
MAQDIDHTTCSARLRAYVAGKLDDRTAASVARHLESCPHCAEERRAVALLHEEPPPLTPDDRARLHAAVREEVSGRGRAGQARSWRRRLAPALAAAAALAVLAVGAPLVLTGSQDSALEAGRGAGDAGGADSSTESDQLAGGAGAERGAARTSESAPRPRFDPSAGALSPAVLRRMGRNVPRARSTSFASEDAAAIGEELSARLVRQAPPEVADQIEECVEVVRRQSPGVLPVHGAAGTLEGTEVLVVAFVRGRGGRGALDGYQVWAWPRGSCDAPVSFQAGRAAR